MDTIPLLAVPNQELTVTLNGIRWKLRVVECNACMAIDLYKNNTLILEQVRICPGTPVIPYKHLAQEGNFYLVVDNDELPDWSKFGSTQWLVFSS